MNQALDFLLQKARRNGDGSLTVSRDLLKKVKALGLPQPTTEAKPKRRRSRKKEDE